MKNIRKTLVSWYGQTLATLLAVSLLFHTLDLVFMWQPVLNAFSLMIECIAEAVVMLISAALIIQGVLIGKGAGKQLLKRGFLGLVTVALIILNLELVREIIFLQDPMSSASLFPPGPRELLIYPFIHFASGLVIGPIVSFCLILQGQTCFAI